MLFHESENQRWDGTFVLGVKFSWKKHQRFLSVSASDGYQSDTIEIDFSMNNCIKKVDSIFQKVEKITYQQIMNRHLEDYQPLFKQSKLYLNEEDNG